MDLSVYDKEYDTDEVSVTSTVPSESNPEKTYDVDTILSEGLFPQKDGSDQTRYLIKWMNYEPHESSWEPVENIDDEGLLRVWHNKIAGMSEDEFENYCKGVEDEFDLAIEAAEHARARKLAKRAKKRHKLAREESAARRTEAESDDDRPLLPERRSTVKQAQTSAIVQSEDELNGRKSSRSIAEKRKQAPRTLVEPQSSSGSSSDDDDDSGDSLLEEVINKSRQREPKEPEKSRSGQPDQSTPDAHTKNTGKPLDTPTSRKLPERKSSRKSSSTVLAEPSEGHGSKQTPVGPAAAIRRKSTVEEVASSSRRSTSLASSASTILNTTARGHKTPGAPKGANPIKMINQPKASARKPWNTANKHFSTLKFRSNAEKRGRREGTPDLGALEFVNGTPEGLTTDTPGGRRPSHEIDNPYGRRGSGQTRLQDFTRDDGVESESEPTVALQPYERTKIPLVCFDWHNRSCSFSAEECRFLHRAKDATGKPYKFSPWNGAVPPKYATPPHTCFFWLRADRGCNKSAEDCMYAHENTGWLPRQGQAGLERIDPEERPSTNNIRIEPEERHSTTSMRNDYEEFPPTSNSQLTCYFWFTSERGCSKSAENCKFVHKNTGLLKSKHGSGFERIEPSALPVFKANQRNLAEKIDHTASIPTTKQKVPPGNLTCYFWSTGVCRNTSENCAYQHRHTGRVADPPKFLEHGERGPLPSLKTEAPIQSGRPAPDQAVCLDDGSVFQQTVQDDDAAPSMLEKHGLFITPSPPPDTPPARLHLSCADLKHRIETTCKLNFGEMFSYNHNQTSGTMLDRRAFLLFQPKDHMEELELITRWLLMHHVDVYTLWSNGAWEHFREQIVKGGTGVVIAHPDFQHWADIPKFGDILRSKVRLWSVGLQESLEFDPQISTSAPELRFDRIEIFPHGGLIYITDDVFKKKPVEVLKLFELFFAKIEKCRQVAGPIDPWKRVDDGCLLWRLAVRPELMEALFTYCEQHEAEVEAQNPLYVSLLKLYELFAATKYIEQDDPGPYFPRPDDYFPVISERYSVMEDCYYPALSTSQSLANTRMIEYFSGMVVDQRRDYRQFFVVHTEPYGKDAKEWKERVQNIDDVLSPKRFIEEFEKEAKGNRFEFYDWAFPVKKRVDSPSD